MIYGTDNTLLTWSGNAVYYTLLENQSRHCTSSAWLSLLDEIQPVHRLSVSFKVHEVLMW